ncbi:GAF domain-containing protein [uncultured Microscilla sp.]|uniref:GAF domain-containing protein n=1 Tax=uncultured Microscilla sp. TaxID=432653 RepID=UPI00260FE4BA|nr:GAF domain-containing protein [uncultured Microscilla sp.]
MSVKKRNRLSYFIRLDFSSIQGRITFVFVLLALLMFSVILLINYTWLSNNRQYKRIIDTTQPIQRHSISLLNTAKQTQVNLHKYLILKDTTYKTKNRKIWLLTIPAQKDSLLFNLAQNSDNTRLAYVNITQRLEELRQLQKQAEIVYQRKDVVLAIRQFLVSDLPLALSELEKAINRMTGIQKDKEIELLEEYANSNRKRYVIFVVSLVAIILFHYFLGAFIMTALMSKIMPIKTQIANLSKGDLPDPLPKNSDEFGSTVRYINELSHNLKLVKNYANQVGEGRFDSNLTIFNEGSELGVALSEMGKSLQKVYDEEQLRIWITDGLAKFAEILRQSSDDLDHLCYEVISQLVKYIDIVQGGMFILNNHEATPFFELRASYAYDRMKFIERKVSVDEGLIGRVYNEKEMVYVETIPENYLYVESGLGETPPKTLVLLPLKNDKEIEGVVELASFRKFEAHELEFLQRLSESIAATITVVITHQKNERMLSEYQEMTSTLKEQQIELQQNSEELHIAKQEIEKKLKDSEAK